MHPDTILHIYYFEGKIPPHHPFPGEGFLGNWQEDQFSFLFFTHPADAAVSNLLQRVAGLTLLDSYQMTYEEWQGGKVESMQIGQFLFTPPWLDPPLQEGVLSIQLDPGVVFGNGLHPTTRDCLEAMEQVFSVATIESVVDLGTGTGMLALAAAKLGCPQVIAVDFNFLAAKTTAENVLTNGMQDTVFVINGQAEDFMHLHTTLLVANIHYEVMKSLIRAEGFLTPKWFILSGLLRSEVRAVVDYLSTQPVKILRQWDNNAVWHTLLGITLT